jgi:monothiol glutaredoxin
MKFYGKSFPLTIGVKEYKDVNILEDEGLREAVKVFSNWPTIP